MQFMPEASYRARPELLPALRRCFRRALSSASIRRVYVSDLLNRIRSAQVEAGEQAVADGLRKKGLVVTESGIEPWPPYELSADEQRAALVEALALLRRWRKYDAADDPSEDYRLFSETGHFCMLKETALGMDPQNPPRKRGSPA
jgi:hypothetical protein